MNEEELHYRRSEISDLLAYLMTSAPDFPAEDRTTLPKEREEMFSRIARYERDYPSAAKHPRFSLFKIEVAAAFEAAIAGSSEMTRLFQIAGERFEETFYSLPQGPDFIAGPTGVAKA